MAITREIYRKEPIIGRFTQGSIINGCTAEDFPGEEMYGCIITPRCALEHEGKISTVHYLPMVPFDRWFEIVEKPIVYQCWKKELYNKINGKLQKAKVGVDVMDAKLGYEDMIKICNLNISQESQKQPIICLLNAFFDKDENAFNDYLKKGDGVVHEQLKLLIENKKSPYYLVESWEKHNGMTYYVIMLRDVRRIQIDVANKIRIGVSESEIIPFDISHNDLFITPEHNHFYWVEAELASPFIEHIMEAFIHNFGKIGVDDIAGNTEEKLLKCIQ